MRASVLAAVLLVAIGGAGLASENGYPPESVYDTSVGPDEALVDVRVRNSRWPDCYSLETIIRDVFRLEGLTENPDASEAKAFALWKWLHMLKSTGGSRVFEGNPYGKRVRFTGNPATDQIEIRRGDKQLLVYGVHECGGMSRTMAHLWRSAGYLGYQEPSSGHSTCAVRYPDKDGIWRMHTFNPQGHSYYWNPRDNRVGTRRVPVMKGVEYRRFVPPLDHNLRTSLRPGEVVTRKWSNDGYIQKTSAMLKWSGKVGDNKRHMRACVAGQEDQVLAAATDPETYASQLWTGSSGTACSAAGEGGARLHPKGAGQDAFFVYRLASPYVAIESEIEAELVKGAADDVCRLSFSTDKGKTWHVLHEKKEAGAGKVKLELGQKRYWDRQPSITSSYSFLLRAEFRTAGEPASVGMNSLKITVHRQLNMRCLPTLLPGENVYELSAASLRPGSALRFTLEYEVNGKTKSISRTVEDFPHYFRVDIEGLPAQKLKTPYYMTNMGGKSSFNLPEHPLRMHSMRLELVPLAAAKLDESMPAAEARPFFEKSYPNPHEYPRKMVAKADKIPKYESQISGFVPQIPRTPDQPADPREYYNWLVDNLGTTDAKLPKAGEDVKDVIAWCMEKYPGCHNLHTMGFTNVFAHFRDKRTVPVMLEKWKKAPKYGPGDRYIPDALAAMGDRSVIPALTAPLKRLRFDYRVHIAHALGVLGGDEAVKTLQMMAREDPNISVRGEARRQLENLKKRGQ